MSAFAHTFAATLPLQPPDLRFIPDTTRSQAIDARTKSHVWILGRWVDRYDRTLFIAVIPVDAATFRRPEELSE